MTVFAAASAPRPDHELGQLLLVETHVYLALFAGKGLAKLLCKPFQLGSQSKILALGP
jgi:hypothetical protein